MIKYLIVLLDDASISYCHYDANKKPKAMPIDTLRSAIRLAMQENWTLQYVFPHIQIASDVSEELDKMYNGKTMPNDSPHRIYANTIVFEDIDDFLADPIEDDASFVVRVSKDALFDKQTDIAKKFATTKRVDIVLTDINKFTEEDFNKYAEALDLFKDVVIENLKVGKSSQLNLLSDRLVLDKMNNCEAGVSNITLAPNGKFYVCPAFYYEDEADSIGDIEHGLDFENAQLYQLDHAPLCRTCDAYQCHRCVWLNRKTTLEVNTPSHEQCVIAHLERNASRKLLLEARKLGEFLPDKDIPEIDYLDPFDKIK